MFRFPVPFFLLGVLLAFCAGGAPAIAAGGLEASAREAAGAASVETRDRARAAFFAGLPSAGPGLDAQLRLAWTGYLLAVDDAERTVVLNYAAGLPTTRARMLIGAFREFSGLRKAFASAEKAHGALIAPADESSSAKRTSPRDKFGLNSFDAPFSCDLWEDADGFSGRWSDGGSIIDVIASPERNYRGRLVAPDGTELKLLGFVEKNVLTLLGPGLRAVLREETLTLHEGVPAPRVFHRVPVGITSFANRPKEARVLLDSSTGLSNFRGKSGDARWFVHPDGAVEIDPAQGSIFSRDSFGDARIYLEFRHAFNRESLGPRRGNSGVYVMNTYEVQIVDSFGEPPSEVSEGSIYHIAAPRVQASAPPLEWQSLEIEFRAARFDAGGAKIANARMSVMQNGIKIHDDVELPNPTAASPVSARLLRDPAPPGPLMLQNHGNRVQFRNVWVLPLDSKP